MYPVLGAKTKIKQTINKVANNFFFIVFSPFHSHFGMYSNIYIVYNNIQSNELQASKMTMTHFNIFPS